MAIWGEKVYVPAVMEASGITKEQAKTCLYYAIATYLIPEKINLMPLLTIIGPQGTGKTSLLQQLSKLVNEPKDVAVSTPATLRDKLNNTITALIDEGDKVDEDLLIRRYDVETSIVSFNKNYGGSFWKRLRANIFGATIIARRIPFQDPALTSRSIIIRTLYKEGDYKVRGFRKAHKNLAGVAGEVTIGKETSERTRNNWLPLQAIAEYLDDKEWLKYCNKEIEKSIKSHVGSQKYEPDLALLLALRANTIKTIKGKDVIVSDNVPLSTIRNELKTEFDIPLKNLQIEEISRAFGFGVVIHSGYPKVKCNAKRLKKLLDERGI